MKNIAACLIAALLLTATAAAAKPGGGVELSSLAEVEVVLKSATGGEEIKRVEAAKANVAPGDTVIFTLTYINNGDQPATDVAVNNPVPRHMVYVSNSAEGKDAAIEFSVDNGKTYGQLANLKSRTSAGKERPASAADVTNVRWTIKKPIPAGSKGSVSYKAKVK
jgi:uncharacterized repeat protein (TIGR01451 family)